MGYPWMTQHIPLWENQILNPTSHKKFLPQQFFTQPPTFFSTSENFLGSNTYSAINPPSSQALNDMNAISRALKKGTIHQISESIFHPLCPWRNMRLIWDSRRGCKDDWTDFTKESQTWTHSCRWIRFRSCRETTSVGSRRWRY